MWGRCLLCRVEKFLYGVALFELHVKIGIIAK
jgi:hypothetical protein